MTLVKPINPTVITINKDELKLIHFKKLNPTPRYAKKIDSKGNMITMNE
jgi:hypothetical protein